MQQAIYSASYETAPSLLRVFDTARRFIAYRERQGAIDAGTIPPPRTLAEAIDRDFLAFELRRAERELRDAVVALDPDFTAMSSIDEDVITAPPPATAGCAEFANG